MKRVETILCFMEDALHVLGCASLVLIAVMINADILSRFAFKVPLVFQFEAVEFYLMPAVATLSLARVMREGGHLSLEIVHPEVFGRAWPAVRAVMLLAAITFIAALTFKSGQFALKAFVRDEVYFGFIDWPLGWAYLSVPLGCGMLMLRLLFELTRRSAEGAVI